MSVEEDLEWMRDQVLAAQAEATALATQLDQAQAILLNVRKLASMWAVLRTHGSAAAELNKILEGENA
jgi:hypothetical protein